MKKYSIILSVLCILVCTSLGMAQNPTLSIPGRYLYTGVPVSLPLGLNPPDDYQWQAATTNHNSMCDAQGNLQFFVVDGIVYDKDSYYIGEIYYNTTFGRLKGCSEVAIVPDPGNCQRYYIFTANVNGGYTITEPFYAILDMSQPSDYYAGRMGRLVNWGGSTTAQPIKPIIGSLNSWSRANPGYAVSKLRSDNTRLLYLYDGITTFWRLKITSSGIVYDNYMQEVGTGLSNNTTSETELISIENGKYRYACVYNIPATGTVAARQVVYVADMDASGNVLSYFEVPYSASSTITTDGFVHGLEFSPNGRYLYVTHEPNTVNPNPIEYIDVTTQTRTAFVVTGAADFKNSYIEYVTGSTPSTWRMYFITSNRIASIGNPNSPNVLNWNNTQYALTAPNYNQVTHSFGSGGSNTPVYLLPDQIDGMDYQAAFFANEACCLQNTAYTIRGTYTVPASGTWEPGSNPFTGIIGAYYEITVNGTLRVPAGVTLTIKNMIVKFAPGSKVIVDRGVINGASSGKLILNGTTFTAETSCGPQAMWEGVEVWGYSNQNQTTSQTTNKQGFLSVENNSVIEHAKTGAMAVRALSGSSFDVNYTGGIIQGTNSSFRNNIIDVRFMNYNAPNLNPNLSYFNNCRFITNGLLNNPSALPQYHAYLYDVNGVSFRGSDFKNETPASYAYNQTGYGIYGYNSKINVTYLCNNIVLPCTSFDFGSFENLYYGIYATTANTARNLTVNRINFTNVIRGIHHTGATGSTFLRNNFQVDAYQLIQTWGLNMANCTGYRVEENTFTQYNYTSGTPGYDSYGVIVTNSGAVHNEIYKNSFHDIKVGVRAQGNNGTVYDVISGNPDPNAAVGLQILCNTFYGNMYKADIEVSSGRIDYQQGLCSNNTLTPAGNTFSHSTNTADNDISVGAGVLFFTYAHHPDVPRTPQYFDPLKLNLDACSNVSFSASSCPTKINEGVIIIRDKMLTRSDSLQREIQRIAAQFNGGDKEGLLELIRSGNSNRTAHALHNASPFVTTDVLSAYLQTAPHYLDVAEILIKNAPLSPALLQEVEMLGWPADVMKEVYAAQENTSALSEVQNRVSLMGREREEYINRMLSEIQAAPEQYQADDIAALLVNESSQQRKQQLCDFYIDRRDLARAGELIRELVAMYGYDNYIRMAEIQIAMLSSKEYLQSGIVDPAWISLAQQIAEDPADVQNAMKAMAFIAFVKDTMIEFPAEPMTTTVIQSGTPAKETTSVKQSFGLNIYPNPADGMVTVELLGNAAFASGERIEILNMSGQTVREIKVAAAGKRVYFDAGSLEPGVYMLRVRTGTNISEVKKLIVR